MRITRIFVDNTLKVGQDVSLGRWAHRHLVTALRRKPGNPLILFNGRGGEYQAELIHTSRTASIARIHAFVDCHRESRLQSILLQGISKGSRMDYTLQKASELGVSTIQPIISKRCTTGFGASRVDNKMKHWRGVIISACEQCGRTIVPQLRYPVSLEEVLKNRAVETAVVLDPASGQGLSALGTQVSKLTILTGPEGGFSAEELLLAERQGYRKTRLGPRVLRSETAGVVILAVAQMLWGDLG